MINYLKGDATNPIGSGLKIIPHVVNNVNGWGAGFVLSLSKKWPGPEEKYREAIKAHQLKLGETQIIKVEPDIYVANMCAQRAYGSKSRPIPLRYWALQLCMQDVAQFYIDLECKDCSIHAPMFGAGLSGGDWNLIEKMIEQEWRNVPVFIYQYEPLNKEGREYVPIHQHKEN